MTTTACGRTKTNLLLRKRKITRKKNYQKKTNIPQIFFSGRTIWDDASERAVPSAAGDRTAISCRDAIVALVPSLYIQLYYLTSSSLYGLAHSHKEVQGSAVMQYWKWNVTLIIIWFYYLKNLFSVDINIWTPIVPRNLITRTVYTQTCVLG